MTDAEFTLNEGVTDTVNPVSGSVREMRKTTPSSSILGPNLLPT